MPLLDHGFQLKAGNTLGLWSITESVEELLELCAAAGVLDDAGRALVESFGSVRRKREWLATRLICASMLGRGWRIDHSPAGKPYIVSADGKKISVSISHTDQLAAVLVCGQGCESAVDVERITPRIERIRDRFLLPGELAAIPESHRLEHLYIHWCAKEAMYKAFNIPDYDYQNSYALHGISADGIHTGRVSADGRILAGFRVASFRILDYVLCVADVTD